MDNSNLKKTPTIFKRVYKHKKLDFLKEKKK